MERSETYKTLAKRILGDDLYDDCYNFFRECFMRRSLYKIILTRRCFSLFKIFSVILKADRIDNQYGTIITDNAVSLNKTMIREALSNKNEEGFGSASVLIIDDIIIYGRTINELLSHIFDSVKIDYLLRLRVICMIENTGSMIDEKYRNLVLSHKGASSVEWKKYSYKFSRLIKAADISNTSYIVSYRGVLDKIGVDFVKICSRNMFFIKNKELSDLNIDQYVLSVSLKNGDFCGLVRVYIYKEIGSFLIAPLIIPNEMDLKTADEKSKKLVELYCKGVTKTAALLESGEEETKMRMLTLLMSHVLLNDFVKKYGIPMTPLNLSNESEMMYDNVEIIRYNFGVDYSNEFEIISKQIQDSKSDEFIYKSEGIYDDTKIFENFIFAKAMQDNAAAREDDSKRRIGFRKREDGLLLFEKKFAGNIMNTLDNGIAALRGFVDESKFSPLLYPGEQAFRVMSDVYPEILPAMYQLEKLSYLYDRNSYSVYIEFLKSQNITRKINDDNIIHQLNEYIQVLKENNQQISDVTYMEVTDDDELVDLAEDFFYNTILEKADV